ncbi:MAG TPA: hypothetical protein VNX02_12395 [Steroidobacteraceae bacterium]|jgi:hypothetical protein|nr:hypothetical protein [Steroidobacteraceae bacterium]
MSMQSLLTLTPWPMLSALILLLLLVAALYLARDTAHQAIQAAAGALARGLRVAAHSVIRAQERLGARNREVLLAAGREAKERVVEREFARVADTVRKDLAGYPDMHRRLSESIQRIEEDQEKAAEVPPEAPGWAQAVKVVANLDARNAGAEILSDIHKSMVKAHGEAMDDYRKASAERHSLLRRMMPDWRLIQQTLGHVQQSVESVIGRSQTIDRQMGEYEAIVRGEDRAVSVLSSSSIVYFFVSALVLAVATAGTAVNFTLIARPMAEMVGGTNFIGGYRTADIAALVIIMVEISMGLFLMESMRITRLFPVIGALSDKTRVRMGVTTFLILLLMASIEAGLAYMREVLLLDEMATNALLRGDNSASLVNPHLWITTAAQMGMGFVLPFALVFVAIPLETFVHSLRTVVGLIGIALLQALALLLRLLGNGFRHLGALACRLYDLPLFGPLWLEARLREGRRPGAGASGKASVW